MKQEISNSEMGTFRTCRARWGFEYEDGLRPKAPPRVFTWGNTIHAGMEAGYRAAFAEGVPAEQRPVVACDAGRQGVRDFHRAYVEDLDALVADGVIGDDEAQERWEDAARMLEVSLFAVPHALAATREDLLRLVPLGFEVPFRVPVYDERGRPHGLNWTGKIDAVWWDPEMQRIVIDDHKSTDGLVGTTEKKIALDPQMSGYMHAVRHLLRTGAFPGLPMQGVGLDGQPLPEHASETIGACRYNVIKRSAPKVPKVNKVRKNDGLHTVTAELADREKATGESQGLVSVAAIDTTAAVYEQALVAQVDRGLPVTDDQRALLERLRGQGDRYFARFDFWRGSHELEHWRREAWVEARLMREASRLPVLRTRNPGACTHANSLPCAYRAVCMDDAPETRALYRVAELRHEEVGI